MPVESNIDRLEREILERSNYMEKDVNTELIKLVGDIQQNLIEGGSGRKFVSRTGNLRRSISVALSGNELTIQMLMYGFFLSFGVNGRNRANAFGLTSEVSNAFGVAEGYRFGSQNVYGIDPFDFYPMDIEDKLLNILDYDG